MAHRIIIAAGLTLGMAVTATADRGGPYSVEQKLTASDAAEDDSFGSSVAISGTTAVVGARHEDDGGSSSGSVYVYQQLGDGTWGEIQKLTASDAAELDYFGTSVAISGDWILIGANEDDDNDSNSGSAYLFQRQGDGTWSEIQKLIASDGATKDRFGQSVAISGETAIIGAWKDDDNGSNSGSAYLFQQQDDGSWAEVQKLTASDGTGGEYFGWSVSISGEQALVGAYYDDSDAAEACGSAYLFERQDDETWVEQQKLVASDSADNDFFGMSVSVSADAAVVGVPNDDDVGSGSGSAYVFQRQDDDTWSEAQKLTATNTGNFGDSVAIFDDMILIGSTLAGNDEVYSGAAFLYQRQADDSWIEFRKLTPSDGETSDNFGERVAISAGTALIASINDDDHGTSSGSAYIYTSPTPAGTGACCVHTGCDILTREQCVNLGGEYLDGTLCDECDPLCLADINANGIVGVGDLLEVIDTWGPCP
ncbi:MAG: FG-GAP repeat protein [Phycisphaerales bacterium]|nr:FG-GAP repeat protein [Phycisphaerales bacterium]